MFLRPTRRLTNVGSCWNVVAQLSFRPALGLTFVRPRPEFRIQASRHRGQEVLKGQGRSSRCTSSDPGSPGTDGQSEVGNSSHARYCSSSVSARPPRHRGDPQILVCLSIVLRDAMSLEADDLAALGDAVRGANRLMSLLGPDLFIRLSFSRVSKPGRQDVADVS